MNLLLWVWCFPQMLLGYIVKWLTAARRVEGHYEYPIRSGSVTLGEYIFLCPTHHTDETVLRHEYGHVLQSRRLGWLYLIVIGIPSLIWAGCFKRYRKQHNVSYYAFYTERWADKLGGVKR